MEFAVLGRLEVLAGGRRLELGGPKQRAVLAMLIASDGRRVSTGSLIDAVYGEDAPDRAHRSIHTFVSNLRRELGDVIEPDGDGYILTADRASVDADRFEGLVARAAEGGDPQQASELLREALGLWRGHPYADYEGSAALAAEITRLNELRVAAIEARIDADLQLGRHRELIGELEALTAEYPLRERFRAQHMLALYRAGRQAEALRAFERTRSYLAEELGLEPTAALRDLEQRILEQDPELAALAQRSVRRLAVLVADVDDPRALAALLPADRHATITHQSAAIDAAVASHGGDVVARRGSAVYASFAEAGSAAAAADAMLQEPVPGDSPQLRLRAAIAVGDVEAADGGVTGPPITRAAALVGVARGGQVLLTPEAQTSLTREGDRWLIRGLGVHDIPALDGDQVIFQLVVEGVPADSSIRTDALAPALPSLAGISGYELREEVGRGAFGVVRHGYQRSVGREVAIKVIRPELANDADFIRRFEVEAQLVARLEHPHIVPLYDYWRSPDGAMLVMPWLGGGGTLEARLIDGPLAVDEASRLLGQVGPAVAYAHRHGVVHQDIKPSNVLLDEDGNAYLTDFGVALTGGRPADDVAALGELLGRCVLVENGHVADVVDRARSGRFEDVSSLMDAWDAAVGGLETGIAALGYTPTRNPYKGLCAFGELDADDFHGRDAEIAQLVEVMAGRRLVALVGPSGTGKSSVVRAGLIPALRHGRLPGSNRWFITDLVPGHYPFEELTSALMKVAAARPADLESELRRDARGLITAVRRYLPDDAELLILIDQFEELFTLVAADAERTAFLELLRIAVTDERSPVRVVLTMRADYFDLPLRFGEFGELLRTSTVPLSVPTADELRAIVAFPAERLGVRFEPGLVARIVSDVQDQPGALPLLEFSLTQLFGTRDSDMLTLESYEAAGGVLGALGRRAEEAFLGLDAPGRVASRQLLLRLVNVSESGRDTRRRVRLPELRHLGIEEEPVLEAFTEPRLLTFDRDPLTRGPTVEVAHEALLSHWPRFAGWIDEQREHLVLRARLAVAVADWESSGRAESHLLTRGVLAQHEAWTEDTDLALTTAEREFLDASRGTEDARLAQRRRTRRAVVAGFGVAAMIGLVLAVVATVAWNRARDRASVARAGELVAASIVELDRDPELSLLLAIEANETAPPTAESVAALRRALFDHRGILTYTVAHGGIPGGDLSPDGGLLAVAGHSSGVVEMVDVDTGSVTWQYDLGDDVVIYQPFFVADGGELVVPAYWTGEGVAPSMVAGLHLLDSSSGEVVRFVPVGECGVFDAGTRSVGVDYVYATVPDCGRNVRPIFDVIAGVDTPDDLPIMRISLDDGTATTAHEDWAYRLTSSADETRLAMTTRDGAGQDFLRVLDATGETLFELQEDFSAQVAAISPNGQLLVYEQFPGGALIVVEIDSGREVARFFGHGYDVTNAWFDADGEQVYSTGRDGTLQVWDPWTGETHERVPVGAAATFAAVSAGLGRAAVFSAGSAVKVYDLGSDGGVVGLSHDPVGFGDECAARFNQSLGLQVVGSTATMLTICFTDWADGYQPFRQVSFDVTTGEPSSESWPALGLNSRLSPDGSSVAGFRVGDDGFTEALVIADVETGEAVASMAGLCGIDFDQNAADECTEYPDLPFADTGALTFAPDGSELAMAGRTTNAVVVWDAATGDLIETWRTPGELLGIGYNQDGTRLIAGTSDGLTVYSTDDWSVVTERSWDGESGAVPGQLLVSTTDGTRLVAVASDRAGGSDVFVLDPVSLQTIGRLEQPQDGAVRMLDVSGNDRRLATAGTDGFVRVWDLETLRLEAEIPISDQAVTNVQFVDDDRRLLVTTQESDVIVVDLEPESLLQLARGRLTRSFTKTECTTHDIDPCPMLQELQAGVPPLPPDRVAVAVADTAETRSVTTTAAPTTTTDTAEPNTLVEPDLCSAPDACPDFSTALPGDDGAGPPPLGSADDLPNEHRLDFLFRVCSPECVLDAHFMDPANPERGSARWTAGEPFHIRHGFVNPGSEPLGEGFNVAVYVAREPSDGDPPEVARAVAAGYELGEVYEFTPDYVLRGTSDRCGPTFETQTAPVTCEWFVHDFPDGLPAGRFTLWAVWEAPCEAWVELGLAEACGDPAEVISLFSTSFDSPFGDFPPEYEHESD